jgi:2-polyprenyl-6-hydroxyphenyl methylase/3-demethylubiquinone-9 3-methyltransferase
MMQRPDNDTPNQDQNIARDAEDRIAQVYFGLVGSQRTIDKARARIDWIVQTAKGQHVLDVGCSEGIVSLLLARRGLTALGIDINPGAIEAAVALAAAEPDPVKENLSFLQHDIQESTSNFPRKYDTIILGEVLEHLSSHSEILVACKKLLADEGRIIITTPFGYFPHPDHHTTFGLQNFCHQVRNLFEPEHISVCDGYIRFVGSHSGRARPGWSAYSDSELLRLSEEAMIRSQQLIIDDNNELRLKLKALQDKVRKLQHENSQMSTFVRRLSPIKAFRKLLIKARS